MHTNDETKMTSAHLHTPLRILFTGATGYIGGSVLQQLLVHPQAASFDIISYSRNAERAQKLEREFGVKSVLGTLDDVQKIEDTAAAADVVFHFADSADHLASAQAIIRGLKRKHAESGQIPIYIHTSGTGVIIDDSKGYYKERAILYDDTNVEQIKAIPNEAMHRQVDLQLVAADEAGYVRTYIVLPGAVFSLASGPLFSAGLANRQPILSRWFTEAFLARRNAGVFGDGTNVWPWVHIDDTAAAYIEIFNALLDDPQRPGHGWDGFYFVETGELRMIDVVKTVEKALLQLDKIKPTAGTLVPWSQEEIDKYFYGTEFLGSNCRAVATRARALGWKPKYTAEDSHAAVLPEIEYALAHI